MKAWQKEALKQALKERNALEDEGHKIVMYTDWHWKINGVDVWPSSKKYMKNGRVRKYDNLRDVL